MSGGASLPSAPDARHEDTDTDDDLTEPAGGVPGPEGFATDQPMGSP